MGLYEDNVIKTRLLNARIINAGAAVEKAIVFAIWTRFKCHRYRAKEDTRGRRMN